MTQEVREGIITSVEVHTGWLFEQYPIREAYNRSYEFITGVQYGAQDAEITNRTNAILRDLHLRLSEAVFEELTK